MESLINIEPVSRHHITGRGTVFVINVDDYKDYKFRIGDRIKINNKLYTLAGIEGTLKLLSPPIPGKQRGLLVRPYKEE